MVISLDSSRSPWRGLLGATKVELAVVVLLLLVLLPLLLLIGSKAT